MMKKSSAGTWIVAIILILLVAGVIIGVWYYSKLVKDAEQKEEQPVYDVIQLLITDKNNTRINATYDFRENGITVDSGNIYDNVVQQYLEGNYSKNYTMYAYSDKYYLNSVNCTGSPTCIIILEKMANPILTYVKLKQNLGRLTIFIDNEGIIRKPLLCIGHSVKYKSINPSLNETNIPTRLKDRVDGCYLFESDISEKYTDLQIEYETRDIEVLEDNFIEFFLLDMGFNSNFAETYESENTILDKQIKYMGE